MPRVERKARKGKRAVVSKEIVTTADVGAIQPVIAVNLVAMEAAVLELARVMLDRVVGIKEVRVLTRAKARELATRAELQDIVLETVLVEFTLLLLKMAPLKARNTATNMVVKARRVQLTCWVACTSHPWSPVHTLTTTTTTTTTSMER